MSERHARVAALTLFVISFAVLYAKVMRGLVSDWIVDDTYSHGFFIVPLAAYFVWERRKSLSALRIEGTPVGLAVVLTGILVLVAGQLGAELFLSRVSMLFVAGGALLYVLGWNHLRALAFPLLFLLLMIPIPTIIFNSVAFPLQLVASRFGETLLQFWHVPVLREGNVIILANTTLEVAEACSGIRSLMSLLALAIVYGYFMDPRPRFRILLAIATVPIAIVSNGVRVAGSGLAAHYYGPDAARGFLHESTGMIVFAVAFAILVIVARLLRWALRTAAVRPAVAEVTS